MCAGGYIMINKETRKTKDGKEILEEKEAVLFLKELCNDTLLLDDTFSDMQMLICDMLGKLSDFPLTTKEIELIFTLQQICMTILEKINTKLQ